MDKKRNQKWTEQKIKLNIENFGYHKGKEKFIFATKKCQWYIKCDKGDLIKLTNIESWREYFYVRKFK